MRHRRYAVTCGPCSAAGHCATLVRLGPIRITALTMRCRPPRVSAVASRRPLAAPSARPRRGATPTTRARRLPRRCARVRLVRPGSAAAPWDHPILLRDEVPAGHPCPRRRSGRFQVGAERGGFLVGEHVGGDRGRHVLREDLPEVRARDVTVDVASGHAGRVVLDHRQLQGRRKEPATGIGDRVQQPLDELARGASGVPTTRRR